MKIAFFEIEQWEADYVKEKLPGNELFFTEEKLNKDNLPIDKDFDAASIFVGSEVKKEVIDYFPNLKFLTTRSTGFDHIDLEAVKQKNIKTGYVPGYGDNTVAEFAFALLLNFSRKIFESVRRVKQDENFSFDGLQGFDLNGKTIGIIGVGRIGKFMVKIAKGFGMNILAYDVYPNEVLAKEMGFSYASLDDLLANSDVISLHIPYMEANHNFIDSEKIKKMKKGVVLINTARGGLVKIEDVVRALIDKTIGGYCTDVLKEEGIIKDERAFLLYGHPEEHNLKAVIADHVLMEMPNVIITPHNAFNTKEALIRILDTDIENIKSFIEKGETKFLIPIK